MSRKNYDKAIDLFKRCKLDEAFELLNKCDPDDGHVDFMLGKYYYWGYGHVKRDFKKAYQHFTEAAKSDDLGKIYVAHMSSNAKRDQEKGEMYEVIKRVLQRRNSGDYVVEDACIDLIVFHGIYNLYCKELSGDEKLYDDCLNLVFKHADDNIWKGHFNLALIGRVHIEFVCRNETGSPVDIVLRHLKAASNAGYSRASYMIAQLYLRNTELFVDHKFVMLEKDLRKGMDYLTRAAQQGEKEAVTDLFNTVFYELAAPQIIRDKNDKCQDGDLDHELDSDLDYEEEEIDDSDLYLFLDSIGYGGSQYWPISSYLNHGHFYNSNDLCVDDKDRLSETIM
jgi:TPR repeat protein